MANSALNPGPKPACHNIASVVDSGRSVVPPVSAVSGLAGLDRKQMEEERLARAHQKRKRSNEPETMPNNARRQKLATHSMSPGLLQCGNKFQAKQQIRGSTNVQYPDGVVKKTWVHGFPRNSDDIKVEEVVQKAGLELAVFSAFQIDTDWITSKLDEKTKVIWVLQAKSDAEAS